MRALFRCIECHQKSKIFTDVISGIFFFIYALFCFSGAFYSLTLIGGVLSTHIFNKEYNFTIGTCDGNYFCYNNIATCSSVDSNHFFMNCFLVGISGWSIFICLSIVGIILLFIVIIALYYTCFIWSYIGNEWIQDKWEVEGFKAIDPENPAGVEQS